MQYGNLTLHILPLFLFGLTCAQGQTIQAELPPNEAPGERPYEMVWAKRVEPALPTVQFDQLQGWSMQVEGAAQATLQPSRSQNVWDRPVGKLRYKGDGKKESKPRILISLSQPITLPTDADSVDMWVYGNRWDWENPPDTPPVRIILHLRDAKDQVRDLAVDTIRWKEWWLMHKRLPEGARTPTSAPVRLESLEIAGGWQADWREIYFDSIRFYHEELPPLTFQPQPRRNLKLFEGQSAGANTGPGRLPVPTREETILPMNLSGPFRNEITQDNKDQYRFSYKGQDCDLSFTFRPAKGVGGLAAEVNSNSVGLLMFGAGVRVTSPDPKGVQLVSVRIEKKQVIAEYADGTTLRLQIWQKSLVLDVINRTGQATELNFGSIDAGSKQPRTIWVPYLTYGGGAHPCVLLSEAGTNHFFTSIWLDWYRSNGSEPYAAESVEKSTLLGNMKDNKPHEVPYYTARINGGVRYHPRTDGKRNPMFERIFITVSPTFEEVLPTVPNPVGLHAKEATDRLWQESWGPADYEKEMKRSRMLRAYGIEKLIQCNHEIAWRDGGESFTLRTRAAPKKGGDEALQRYVAHQRSLDWFAGLYSNYTDYAPVNEFWSPDGVQRSSDGNWRTAWPRNYAEKPLKAVEFDALLAPQIKKKYNPNSAYTDVQTAVAPWHYNDYDARVPGAGTFAQTFYSYCELLRNDSQVYGGPIFSEGSYHWLYAGMADGNYALAYDGRPLAKEPLLPVFDLYQIHTKECDIGMGWTANFCDAIPNWTAPTNIDRAVDRFLLHTMAYGHIGWLVEETHGITRACRSYYMLQPVQAAYGLQKPQRIAYWDGSKLCNVSEALMRDLPRTRRQLYIEYPKGLELWLNDHPTEQWDLNMPVLTSTDILRKVLLPPAGWAVTQKKNNLLTYSALDGTNKVDYLTCESYTYMDGRGHMLDTAEASSNGALVISPLGKNRLEVIRISGEGAFVIRRPYGVKGTLIECETYDVDGKRLDAPKVQDSPKESRIEPVPKAIKYILRFGKTT